MKIICVCTKQEKTDYIEYLATLDSCPYLNVSCCKTCEECIEKNIEWQIEEDGVQE